MKSVPLVIVLLTMTWGLGGVASSETPPPSEASEATAFATFRSEQVKKFNEFVAALRAEGISREELQNKVAEYARDKLVKAFLDFKATEDGKKAAAQVDREVLGIAIHLAQDEKVVEQVLSAERDAKDSLELKLLAAEQYGRRGEKAKAKPWIDAVLKESESKFPKIHAQAKMALFRLAPEGQVFPELPEWTKDTDGKPLRVGDYRGKLLLIDFWATWCPPCREEVPSLVKAYEEYHKEGFEVIGISFDYSKEEFQRFIKEKKMTWRQYFDGLGWDNKVGKEYGIGSIPAMYLLDKEGKVITDNARGKRLHDILAKRLGGNE